VTDGDAIHAKILAEPDEDVHRLAYADWLDEQGDPARAEFVRVQCRLALHDRLRAQADAAGEPWLDGMLLFSRRTQLQTRERELWGRYCRKWLGIPETHNPLEFLAVELAQYRRGFIESVRCSGDKWARHGDDVLAAHPVRRVTLTSAVPFVDLDAVRGWATAVAVRLVLSARWPRVPPGGWVFAPPTGAAEAADDGGAVNVRLDPYAPAPPGG